MRTKARKIAETIAALMSLVIVGTAANAGLLSQGGTIVRVANTSGNQSLFVVLVAGGSGPCPNGQWIAFPTYAAGDAEVHKRAYAMALLALTTGMKVAIHNYNNDNCNEAAYIEIYP
jgi:hypothetical protein